MEKNENPISKDTLQNSAYILKIPEIIDALKADTAAGLSQTEADKRLSKYGKNLLPEPERTSPVKLFLKQFANFMIYILMGAVALSLVLRDIKDAVLIGIVILLNALIGFFQEYKAEKTLASLKKMSAPTAKVMRSEQIEELSTSQLVPGDIVIIEEGDIVPADMRLIESVGLSVNEAILTGESVASQKSSEIQIKNKAALGDQLNMVFMGTVVASGHGRGIVTATGTSSQMGKIAETLAIPYDKPTPLQKNLDTLGRYLVIAAVSVCVVIFMIGFFQGRELEELLFTVISLAVAVIPEGLLAVVTVTLAVGVQSMAKKNAIVRHLPAIETIGAVNVICTDKTGTLTEEKMVATDFWVANKLYTVSGTGIEPQGEIYCDDKPVRELNHDLKTALTVLSLCNDAVLQQNDNGIWEGVGDPTEVALQVLSHKMKIKKEELEKTWEFIEGLPFDAERKRMSVLYENTKKEVVILTKGAAEEVLSVCSHFLEDGKTRKLEDGERDRLRKLNLDMSGRGLRVLGIAIRQHPKLTFDIESETVEKDMVFVGMVGVLDPPRPEVEDAVSRCIKAGIKVIMVTGDHPATAKNIGMQLGIYNPEKDEIMTNIEMDKLSEEELCEVKPFPTIFARVSPENKLMLVRSLRRMKFIVAMTGDGVNDAPAIKHANIGISMGMEGTDVTKQASDIVLADDNFATIVSAISEGRRIFTNIQKFIRYLLSCNMGNVFSILLATAAGFPFPFSPIQILWLNLVTDTPPALALGFDESEKDSMENLPRDTKKGIFRRVDLVFILYHGAIMAFLMLTFFLIELTLSGNLDKARTMAFAMLVLTQLTQAFNAKSTGTTLFRRDLFNNKGLIAGVLFSFTLLVAGIYLPFLNGIFQQVALSLGDWLKLSLGVVIFILLAELFKFARRRLD